MSERGWRGRDIAVSDGSPLTSSPKVAVAFWKYAMTACTAVLDTPLPLTSTPRAPQSIGRVADTLTFYTLQSSICRMVRHREKADLLQGTLDLLILQVVALEPVHGYAIAQRLSQISREALQVQQGSLYPRCIGSSTAAGCARSGGRPTAAARRSSTP